MGGGGGCGHGFGDGVGREGVRRKSRRERAVGMEKGDLLVLMIYLHGVRQLRRVITPDFT